MQMCIVATCSYDAMVLYYVPTTELTHPTIHGWMDVQVVDILPLDYSCSCTPLQKFL